MVSKCKLRLPGLFVPFPAAAPVVGSGVEAGVVGSWVDGSGVEIVVGLGVVGS